MTNSYDWLKERFESYGSRLAIVSPAEQYTYNDLLASTETWRSILDDVGVEPGDCVAIDGEYCTSTISFLMALVAKCCVAVPLSGSDQFKQQCLSVATVGFVFSIDEKKNWQLTLRKSEPRHGLLVALSQRREPGLILFSSGSTGPPKASLLSFNLLLNRFQRRNSLGMNTLAFLLLDHIGGINTLFAVLTQGGKLVTPKSRDAQHICQLIEQHDIELLPTSPTFLRMLLISAAFREFNLASLKLVTYGTEPMPDTTLSALNGIFPNIRFKQTYGLSELGIMSTHSKSSDSTLLKVGGEDFQYKVVDEILFIKSKSAMLGYLNAANPFDDHGWFNTGDVVEIHGDYLRVLGRVSEIINVGGLKVYPNEVESVLLQDSNVSDATVSGKSNPVTGQVVVAKVKLIHPEEQVVAVARLKKQCSVRLDPYKVPLIISVSDEAHHGARFKKKRWSALV